MVEMYRIVSSTKLSALCAAAELAVTDPLTGAGNRLALRRRVEAIDPKTTVTVVVADIDGLKAINDTKGHGAGDAAINRAAHALSAVGEVYRLGGDEFAVIAPHFAEGMYVGPPLGAAISYAASLGGVSVGVAAGEVSCQADFSRLMAAADAAMYQGRKHRAAPRPAAVPERHSTTPAPLPKRPKLAVRGTPGW